MEHPGRYNIHVTPELESPKEILDGGRLRGGVFRSHIQWVRDTHGDVGLVKLWTALPTETAEALVGELFDTGLYAFRHLIALDRSIARLFGFEDEPTLVALGAYSARINLSTRFKDFNKNHPHAFFEQSARLHAQFQDFGRALYEKTGPMSCRMKMTGYPCYSKVFCWSAVGYYSQATEMQGGANVRIRETQCQCEGAEACVFDIRWE